MIRTLHRYLSRELARITLLALVAFTLVMTTFAIIEPLRKRGLASDQVAALFVYTLPVMLSLTLPIAALFAATIVYGRFSQDREFMACRASGVSTFSLLKPAIVLGVLVTIFSLALNNYVAPKMVARGARAVEANIRGIAYRQLRTEKNLRVGGWVLHADQVIEDSDALRGVVVINTKQRDRMLIVASPSAFAHFDTHEGESYVTPYLIDPVVGRRGGTVMARESSQAAASMKLPNPAEEEPSWYDWQRLVETLRQPEKNAEIRRRLADIRRQIRHGMLVRDVVDTLQAGEPYDKLVDPHTGRQFVIRAAGAKPAGDETARLVGRDERRVSVTIRSEGRTVMTITGDSGDVRVAWSAMDRVSETGGGMEVFGAADAAADGTSFAAIRLAGNVSVERAGSEAGPLWRGEWVSTQLPIPEGIRRRVRDISLEDIYTNPTAYGDGDVAKAIRKLKSRAVDRLLSDIHAEMHGRVAYGLSCFLLVSLGAALGLMFRGGQVISAFAISVVPAAVVIVMIIMGKEMVKNPDVENSVGLAVIWAGIIALAAGTSVVYLRLVRK